MDGLRPQLNAAQPLSLNLYYLLTAWADTFYDQEQQAMTVALQTFHSVPIYRPPLTNDEFTISVEADTIEEMSRLWQAFTVPMRLSCVVKVGVVFVAPSALPPPVAKPPVTANVAVGPIPASSDPPVLYAAMNLAFAPYPPPTDATLGVVTGGELVAVGGSSVLVRGAGLDRADAAQVFLSTPDGLTEWQVTAAPSWRRALTDPADPTGAATLELVLPAAYSDPVTGAPAPPNRTPTPGVYRLAVGRNPGVRSNRVPLTVAARIDSLTGPSGGLYTLTGAGFAPAATSVSVAGHRRHGVGDCHHELHHLCAARRAAARRNLRRRRDGERRSMPSRPTGDSMSTVAVLRPEPPPESAASGATTLGLILAMTRARAQRLTLWMERVWQAGRSSPDQGLAITAGEVAWLLAADDAAREEAAFLDADPRAAALGLAARSGAARTRAGSDMGGPDEGLLLGRGRGRILALLAAVEADPGLQRVIAYLNDDARLGRPTPELSARLAGRTSRALGGRSHSPLALGRSARRRAGSRADHRLADRSCGDDRPARRRLASIRASQMRRA